MIVPVTTAGVRRVRKIHTVVNYLRYRAAKSKWGKRGGRTERQQNSLTAAGENRPAHAKQYHRGKSAKGRDQSLLLPHSPYFPLDLAEIPSTYPAGSGGYFVSQRDFILPDGGLELWCVAQESGIVVPLDGYPTSHIPGDCDGYSSIGLR